MTLMTYTVSLLMRLLNWVAFLKSGRVPENMNGNVVVYMVDLVASMLIWLVLYYFLFEMRIVRDKLASQTHHQYIKRHRATKSARIFVFLSVSSIFLVVIVINLVQAISETEESLISSVVDFVCRILKIAVDTYLFVMFIELLSYFIKRKST